MTKIEILSRSLTMGNLDFPAANGQPVMQRHANACANGGHATHTVDGIDTGVCPRCGAVKDDKSAAKTMD